MKSFPPARIRLTLVMLLLPALLLPSFASSQTSSQRPVEVNNVNAAPFQWTGYLRTHVGQSSFFRGSATVVETSNTVLTCAHNLHNGIDSFWRPSGAASAFWEFRLRSSAASGSPLRFYHVMSSYGTFVAQDYQQLIDYWHEHQSEIDLVRYPTAESFAAGRSYPRTFDEDLAAFFSFQPVTAEGPASVDRSGLSHLINPLSRRMMITGFPSSDDGQRRTPQLQTMHQVGPFSRAFSSPNTGLERYVNHETVESYGGNSGGPVWYEGTDGWQVAGVYVSSNGGTVGLDRDALRLIDMAIDEVGPEIKLFSNGVEIQDGDSTPSTRDRTHFGSGDLASTTDQQFTIRNDGGGVLQLTGSPRVELSGSGASAFTVASVPTGQIAAGSSSAFTIRYLRNSTGTHRATVSIESDDPAHRDFTFTISGQTRAAASPEIEVEGITNGQTGITDRTDFGGTVVGGLVEKSFAVWNRGSQTLVANPSVTGAGSSAYSIVSGASLSLAAGRSGTFTVRFAPTSGGDFSATVSISNNSSNANPFTFAVRGRGSAPSTPEIRVTHVRRVLDSTGRRTVEEAVANGDTTPSAEEGTLFGSMPPNQASSAVPFNISNDGDGELSISSIRSDSQHFVVVPGWERQISAGVTYANAFEVVFHPRATGNFQGTITIISNSPSDSPYTFRVQGSATTVAAPRLTVEGNGQVILNGRTVASTADHTYFGVISVGQSKDRIYRLQNGGTADLRIDYLRIEQGSSAIFSLVNPPSNLTLAPGQFSDVTVRFQPNAEGTHRAGLSIYSNDVGANPFRFQIAGNASFVGAPELTLFGVDRRIPAGSTEINSSTLGNRLPDQDYRGGESELDLLLINEGVANLSISDILFSNPNFRISNDPQLSVPPGGSTILKIAFDPDLPQDSLAEISILSNDPRNGGTLVFPIAGQGIDRGPGQLEVSIVEEYNSPGTSGTPILNNDSTPSLSDRSDFGNVHGFFNRWLVVKNVGPGNMFLDDAVIDGPPGTRLSVGNSQIDPAGELLEVGRTMRFHLHYSRQYDDGLLPYEETSDIVVTADSDGPLEHRFAVHVKQVSNDWGSTGGVGTVVRVPFITLSQGGEIRDGLSFAGTPPPPVPSDFGSATEEQKPMRSFILYTFGVDLEIVSVTTDDPEYVVTNTLPAVLNRDESAGFLVQFDPDVVPSRDLGRRNANLSVTMRLVGGSSTFSLDVPLTVMLTRQGLGGWEPDSPDPIRVKLPEAVPPGEELTPLDILPADFAGNYEGLIVTDDPLSHGGKIDIKVTSGGKFSCKMNMGTFAFRFSGVFDATGAYDQPIQHSSGSQLSLKLHQDEAGNYRLVGSVSGNQYGDVDLFKHFYHATRNPCPSAGKYTFLLPSAEESRLPLGDGHGTYSIRTSGKVTFSGRLGDTYRFTQSTNLSPKGLIPLHSRVYSWSGELMGFVSENTVDSEADFSAILDWRRAVNQRQSNYPRGWVGKIAFLGSKLEVSRGSFPLNLSNDTDDDAIATQGLIDVKFGPASASIADRKVIMSNTGRARFQDRTRGELLTLKLSRTTGLLTGTTTAYLPDGRKKTLSIKGVALPSQNVASGYVVDPVTGDTTWVTLTVVDNSAEGSSSPGGESLSISNNVDHQLYTGESFLHQVDVFGDAVDTGVSGLPSGLQYDSVTHEIFGTIEKAGHYRLTLWAVDADGRRTTSTLLIDVNHVSSQFAGTWESLFQLTGRNKQNFGHLRTRINNGTFSGVVGIGEARRRIRGRFDEVTGSASAAVDSDHELVLELDPETDSFSATIVRTSDGDFSSMVPERVNWTREDPQLPSRQRFTGIVPKPLDPGFAAGDGHGVTTLDRRGRIVGKFRMGNSAKMSFSSGYSIHGNSAVHGSFRAGRDSRGIVSVPLTFEDLEGSDFSGGGVWIGTDSGVDFASEIELLGSSFVRPDESSPIFWTSPGDFNDPFTPFGENLVMDFGLADLTDPGTGGDLVPDPQYFLLTGANRIQSFTGNRLKVSSSTGSISGRIFLSPDQGGAGWMPVNGVVFQKTNSGYGYYRGRSEYSWMTIAPK